MDIKKYIVDTLLKEVKPAVGCTEPVAVALSAAAATELLKVDYKEITEIKVEVNEGLYKNGMDVGIPSIDTKGLDVAASLGAATSSKYGLEILGKITPEEVENSKEILKSAKVDVVIAEDTTKPVYIKTLVTAGSHTATAITEDKHDNIVYLALDDKEILNKKNEAAADSTNQVDDKEFYSLKIDTIVDAIEEIDFEDIKFLLDGSKMNLKVAELGIEGRYGLGTGYSYNKNIEKGLISKDFINLAYMLTAAASDVRMSGHVMPVMSSSGSGNNGLTAILPIVAYAELNETSDEDLARALAISHIITSYIKKYIGRLSNLCGCSLAASIGSGSAIAWLVADKSFIGDTINNIIANQSGVICDGAKAGCALKLGTAASTAVQSALLAIEGTKIEDYNGITDMEVEQSIRNLAQLSSNGMKEVDDTVVKIMLDRGN